MHGHTNIKSTVNSSLLPKFRDKISVPSSRIKQADWPLKMELIDWSETSVTNYQFTLRGI